MRHSFREPRVFNNSLAALARCSFASVGSLRQPSIALARCHAVRLLVMYLRAFGGKSTFAFQRRGGGRGLGKRQAERERSRACVLLPPMLSVCRSLLPALCLAGRVPPPSRRAFFPSLPAVPHAAPVPRPLPLARARSPPLRSRSVAARRGVRALLFRAQSCAKTPRPFPPSPPPRSRSSPSPPLPFGRCPLGATYHLAIRFPLNFHKNL